MNLPVATARALLAGFAGVGLPADRIREEAGIDAALLERLEAELPGDTFGALWEAALRRAPRPELPTEVGLAIPFGAFGALDYLAGSSATVEAGFLTLAAHFHHVSPFFTLDVETDAAGAGVVRILWSQDQPRRTLSDEFTLAVFTARFRQTSAGPFRVASARLPGPPPPAPPGFMFSPAPTMSPGRRARPPRPKQAEYSSGTSVPRRAKRPWWDALTRPFS
ncbi:MAG TPA: AraC family transcriptional regulator ligand-binding domain-containing protein [Thermoanaerobaculia bacterium]|nr:AraC family transcriptional regulator ligand-binding domain-containing protein [Thermoanaerobaculia bacterium]